MRELSSSCSCLASCLYVLVCFSDVFRGGEVPCWKSCLSFSPFFFGFSFGGIEHLLLLLASDPFFRTAGAKIAKGLHILINVLFLIAGGLLIAAGAFVLVTNGAVLTPALSNLAPIAIIVICAGGVIFFVSLIGCIGSCRVCLSVFFFFYCFSLYNTFCRNLAAF